MHIHKNQILQSVFIGLRSTMVDYSGLCTKLQQASSDTLTVVGAPIAPWTDVYYIDGKAMDGTNYQRKVVSTPWEGTQFATFAARLYMVNGFNKPMVFDGRKASPLGFFAPPDEFGCGKI